MEIDWKPDQLVIGPGSTKGFCILGLLHRLKYKGLLDNCKGYTGVSVGSIISLLLCVGYEPIEIVSIAASFDILSDWMSISGDVVSRMKEMKNNIGIIPSNIMDAYLRKVIMKKLGYIPTMSELFKISGKTLNVVTYNMTKAKVVYMNHLTHPDINCVAPTIFSSAIPFIFYKVKFEDDIYVDGALGDPMPLYIADDGKSKVLGVYIEGKHSIKIEGDDKINLPIYSSQLILTPINRLRQVSIENSSERCKFVSIESREIDVIGITISPEDKCNMISNGIKAADKLCKEFNIKDC